MKQKAEQAILIKGGTLYSPESGEYKQGDLLIENGMIKRAEEEILAESGTRVIEATGLIVSPGWMDAHTHVYSEEDTIGISADSMAKSGVTFTADAGTAGPYNFEDMRMRVMRSSCIQVKAYLHIAKWGISQSHGELQDLDNIDVNACQEMCRRYPEDILGFKARIDPRVCADGEQALKVLRGLGDTCGKPVVVHASRSPLPLGRILAYLNKGDIFAHSYAGMLPGLLEPDGTLKDEAKKARARGVIFDLSHGSGNFSFDVARRAMEQGFDVDMISTDLHRKSCGRVVDLASTMTKLLHLGMPLSDVINKVTLAPAALLPVEGRPSRLTAGNKADLTLFRLEQGKFELTDSEGNVEWTSQRIVSVCTVYGEGIFFKDSM